MFWKKMDIIEKVFEVVFFRKLTVSEMIFSLVQLFLAELFFFLFRQSLSVVGLFIDS